MATKKAIKIGDQVTVKAYDVMARAVEEGVSYGLHRAHKHVDNPSRESIEDAVRQAVIDSICEWFKFSDEE